MRKREIKTNFYEIGKIMNENNGEGKLIALCSRPGMGKTTLMFEIMKNISELNDGNVLFFSLEGFTSNRIKEFVEHLDQHDDFYPNFYIDENFYDIAGIENEIEKYENLSAICIDYNIPMKKFAWKQNEEQEELLLRLKKICKEKDIHIFYSYHLPRCIEKRYNKRPILNDIDEITRNTADAVFALYRSPYYFGDDPIERIKNKAVFSGELLKLFPKDNDEYDYSVCGHDLAEEKRVELSVHTKMSDDISTISVRDALDYAINCGAKAIGFTNLNNVQDFPEIQFFAKRHPELKVIYGAKLLCENDDFGAWTTTLLVKNQNGVKNLYKIISSMTEMGNTKIVNVRDLKKHRENLLIGASGADSDLFGAIHDELPDEEIIAIAREYDFFEIFPTNDIKTRFIYQKMVELSRELNIPVIATGNCHYIFKGDEICRNVVRHFRSVEDDNDGQYLRNTDEMLNAFAYLGEDTAYKVVVENTNLIADSIERVEPLSEDLPEINIPNADKDIRDITEKQAYSIYGKPLPKIVKERLTTELEIITNNNFESFYMLAHLLTKYAQDNGTLTASRGMVGSTLVAYFLGITNINPLPPHYRCNKCNFIKFITKTEVYSGYDLPYKTCPVCGEKLTADGHNIPFETFMGFKGDKFPDIDINFTESFRNKIIEYLKEIFGEERVLRAGTVSSFIEHTADLYVKMYEDVNGEEFDGDLAFYIKEQLMGVKRQEGVHPGGIFILPEGKETCDYTPTNKSNGFPKESSHFNFHSLHDTIYKADILGYTALDLLLTLQKKTSINIKDVCITDQAVIDDIAKGDTFCIPSFDKDIVRDMLIKSNPKNFGELVKLSGFAHGTNVWTDNGEWLLENGISVLKIPTLRDDIMNDLIRVGADRAAAFKIGESVRKGLFARGRTDEELENLFKELSKPLGDWYFEFCKKVRYMFPKSHAIEYVIIALQLAWFKKYYPKDFYEAYLDCYLSDTRNLTEEEKEKYKIIKNILQKIN